MADRSSRPEHAADEVNRLYWKSDHSVNRIADDFGMSKGVLYELIDPLASGVSCAGCGAEMAFPNRTARDRGVVTCPACGAEEVVEDGGRAEREPAEREPAEQEPAEKAGPSSVGRLPDEQLPKVLAGSALLGMAAGIVLAMVIRRK